jgi:hypothetical protein
MKLRKWSRTSYLGVTLTRSLVIFTSLGALLGITAIFYPTLFAGQWPILFLLSVISFVSGLLLARIGHVVVDYNNGLSVRVLVGDIFNCSTPYYVGFTDTFGVDVAEHISPTSLQGKYLDTQWNGDAALLREAISRGFFCGHTRPGKHVLGCGSLLTSPNVRRTYCVAQSRLDEKGIAHATTFDITRAIEMFFEAVDANENHGSISIPVLGQGLSRIPGSTPLAMIQLTALLAYARSSKSKFTSEITIIIHPSQAKQINLREVDLFLRALA